MTADREKYVEDNIGLARSCVSRYTGRGIEYDDLFQAACLGLVKAAERFDESRGLQFSTYAVPMILGELKQLFRSGGSVKVSRHTRELGMKAKKAGDEFFSQHGHTPRISELAMLLGEDEQEITEALCAVQQPDSLDSDEMRLNYAASEKFEEPATECLALRQVISRLNDTDRAIITERYIREQTQNATAQHLGMTQVQVSRRERKILGFIRAELEK